MPRVIRHTARVVSAVIACLLVVALLVVEARYAAAASGRAHAPASMAPSAAAAQSPAPAAPRRVADVSYLSEAAAVAWLSGAPSEKPSASTWVTWDDRWLLVDSRAYNHGLARACAVLAAVCNAESCWYSGAPGARPFAEEALAALGFSHVRTDSYAWRSSLLDELGAFLTGSYGGVAYTFAAKTVDPRSWTSAEAGEEGEGAAFSGEGSSSAGTAEVSAGAASGFEEAGDGPVTFVFVGVRGSYGFEWLTNFSLGAGPDHDGYRAAEADLARALASYVDGLGADPARTRVLVTGHSRGGAVANLLAAGLDDLAGTSQAVAPASGVYAYTFASPAVSRTAAEGCHDNIFNVVGEGDPVPRLPLAGWGYGRHGVTVSVPRVAAAECQSGDAALALGGRARLGLGSAVASGEAREATALSCTAPDRLVGERLAGPGRLASAVEAAFCANTGVRFDAEDAGRAAAVLDVLEARAGALGAAEGPLAALAEIIAAAGALGALDPAAAVASHYPDAYIAWMQALDEDDLAFGA